MLAPYIYRYASAPAMDMPCKADGGGLGVPASMIMPKHGGSAMSVKLKQMSAAPKRHATAAATNTDTFTIVGLGPERCAPLKLFAQQLK